MPGILRAVAAAAFALLATAVSARGELIDRILAVVNDEIITLSDVQAVLQLGLVPPEVTTDPVDAVLQQLIDRRLILDEVERYAVPEPEPAAVDEAVAAVRARSMEGAAFETVLSRYGWSQEELRRFVRNTLRIEAYLEQRFAATAQPSEDEVVRYYTEHPAEFTVDGKVKPLDQVHAQARAATIAARRDALMQAWLEGLRRRASLLVLYLPGDRK